MIFEDINKFKNKISNNGILMALDIGTKKIGIATSDFHQIITTPQLTIRPTANEDLFLKIKEQITEFNPIAIIIGLPLNMDESESEMSKYVRNFSKNLDEFLKNYNILLLDERLSSFSAFEILKENKKTKKRKELIDQISAAVILQSFIDLRYD